LAESDSLLAARLPDIDDADVAPLIDRLTPTPGASRYRTAFPDLAGNELRETVLSHWLFRMPALHLAEAAAIGGSRVWLYELRWGFGPRGASHGLDILLVFGTTDVYGEVAPSDLPPSPEPNNCRGRSAPTTWPSPTPATPAGASKGGNASRACTTPNPALIRYPEERSRTIWRDQPFGVPEVRT
jgi:para-nitrobenzyl esterase